MKILYFLLVGMLISGCTRKDAADLEALYRESVRLEKVIVQKRKAGHKKETAEAVQAYLKVNEGLKKYHESEIYEVMKKVNLSSPNQ